MSADRRIVMTGVNPGPALSQYIQTWARSLRESPSVKVHRPTVLEVLRTDASVSKELIQQITDLPTNTVLWLEEAESGTTAGVANMNVTFRY